MDMNGANRKPPRRGGTIERALTFHEAANHLGVGVEAIRELAMAGRFRPVDVGARQRFVDPDDLPALAKMLGVE